MFSVHTSKFSVNERFLWGGGSGHFNKININRINFVHFFLVLYCVIMNREYKAGFKQSEPSVSARARAVRNKLTESPLVRPMSFRYPVMIRESREEMVQRTRYSHRVESCRNLSRASDSRLVNTA